MELLMWVGCRRRCVHDMRRGMCVLSVERDLLLRMTSWRVVGNVIRMVIGSWRRCIRRCMHAGVGKFVLCG